MKVTLISEGRYKVGPEGIIVFANDKAEAISSYEGASAHQGAATTSIESVKAHVTESLSVVFATARRKIVNNADPNKLSGWVDKFQRATRVVTESANGADGLILQTESDARGLSETVDQLAQKQLDKGQALAMNVAKIDGLETRAIKAITAKKTQHAIEKAYLEYVAELETLLGAN